MRIDVYLKQPGKPAAFIASALQSRGFATSWGHRFQGLNMGPLYIVKIVRLKTRIKVYVRRQWGSDICCSECGRPLLGGKL